MDSIWLSLKRRFKHSQYFQDEEPVSGSIELTPGRVFILPTPRGMGMVFTIMLLLVTSFVYNNNLTYLLSFILASIFFVTILHTYKTLSGLVVQVGYAQPVFAGESACFQLTVSNPVSHARPVLSVRLDAEQDFSLDANVSKTLNLFLPTSKRGWQSLGPVTFSSSYPFGIFRAWSALRFDSRVLVYPKRCEYSVPLPMLNGGQEVRTVSRMVERSGKDEFHGIRDYQAGDSLRQIHWRAYAKGQGLLCKQFGSEAGGNELWLDFDQTHAAHVEERLSQLCRWIVEAEVAGIRYGLRLPGKQLAPDRGQKHQLACLETLALF